MIKQAQQRLYFLRKLREAHLSPHMLLNFYRCTIESILTNCITVWYGISNCTVSDQKALQREVKTAQYTTGVGPPSKDVYPKHCLRRVRSIIKDSSHPNHRLFTPLPLGRCYRSLRCHTSRLRNSLFPAAVSLLNSNLRH